MPKTYTKSTSQEGFDPTTVYEIDADGCGHNNSTTNVTPTHTTTVPVVPVVPPIIQPTQPTGAGAVTTPNNTPNTENTESNTNTIPQRNPPQPQQPVQVLPTAKQIEDFAKMHLALNGLVTINVNNNLYFNSNGGENQTGSY